MICERHGLKVIRIDLVAQYFVSSLQRLGSTRFATKKLGERECVVSSLATMSLDSGNERCRPFCSVIFVHDLFSPLNRVQWSSRFPSFELALFIHLNHSNTLPKRNSREISGLRIGFTANANRTRFISFDVMDSSSFVSYLSSFLSPGEIAILTNTTGCGSFLLPQSIRAGKTVDFDATSHCLVDCCVPCPPQGP